MGSNIHGIHFIKICGSNRDFLVQIIAVQMFPHIVSFFIVVRYVIR